MSRLALVRERGRLAALVLAAIGAMLWASGLVPGAVAPYGLALALAVAAAALATFTGCQQSEGSGVITSVANVVFKPLGVTIEERPPIAMTVTSEHGLASGETLTLGGLPETRQPPQTGTADLFAVPVGGAVQMTATAQLAELGGAITIGGAVPVGGAVQMTATAQLGPELGRAITIEGAVPVGGAVQMTATAQLAELGGAITIGGQPSGPSETPPPRAEPWPLEPWLVARKKVVIGALVTVVLAGGSGFAFWQLGQGGARKPEVAVVVKQPPAQPPETPQQSTGGVTPAVPPPVGPGGVAPSRPQTPPTVTPGGPTVAPPPASGPPSFRVVPGNVPPTRFLPPVAPIAVLQETLTVTIPGGGRVTSDPAGIDCPPRCTWKFTKDTYVFLEATDGGAIGSPCDGADSCVVSMDGDKTVSVTFSYQVTVVTSGDGSGEITGATSGLYPWGSTLTFTAEAGSGSTDGGWTDGCAGNTGKTCMVTVSGPLIVGKIFPHVPAPAPAPTPPPVPVTTHTVILSTLGTGTATSNPAGINCPPGCAATSATFADGTTVVITASPTALFGGDCTGTGSCTVVVNGDLTVFLAYQFPVTLIVLGPGSGMVTGTPVGTTDYVPGTSLTLTATANPGFFFAGWGGDCTGTGSCTVVVNTPIFVTATFT